MPPGSGWGVGLLIGPAVLALLFATALPLYLLHLRHARVAAAGLAPAQQTLPVLFTLPDFSLTERGGQAVTLGSLKGKVWIADFIFTHCQGPCPLMTRQMAGLQAALAGVPDLQLVSITCDPKRDTPERLREYAQQAGADPRRWLFLTGDRQAIYDLSAKGFHMGVNVDPGDVNTTDYPILHSTRFALIDRDGAVRGFYDGTSPEVVDRLKDDARRLAAEGSVGKS
jgi:protein SCO1/2